MLFVLHYNDLRINNHTLAALRKAAEKAATKSSESAKEPDWESKMGDALSHGDRCDIAEGA